MDFARLLIDTARPIGIRRKLRRTTLVGHFADYCRARNEALFVPYSITAEAKPTDQSGRRQHIVLPQVFWRPSPSTGPPCTAVA